MTLAALIALAKVLVPLGIDFIKVIQGLREQGVDISDEDMDAARAASQAEVDEWNARHPPAE